jgi:hypothetical protein
MIVMKCPQCGRAAEVPEGMETEGHQCYQCKTRLEFADPEAAARRAAGRDEARRAQVLGFVIGALVWAWVFPVLGKYGGPLGMASAGGVAGALVGIGYGIVEGVIGGLEWALVWRDSSWLTGWAKVLMVVGFIGGAVLGACGQLEMTEDLILILSGVGGALLGGFVGSRLACRSASAVETQLGAPAQQTRPETVGPPSPNGQFQNRRIDL